MPKNRKRTAALLVLCAALLMALAACGRGEEDAVTLHEGAVFTVAVSEMPETLNPITAAGGLTDEFFLLCYDPLWRLNAAGTPEACLAEDWSLSSDKLTWTIRLRHDARFSDGEPVTSADVMFSYDLMRYNETPYSVCFDGITAIRCPDDYTVVISTAYVKGDMLYNQTPILPRHIWRDYEYNPEAFENAAMIGSGPFVYCPEESSEDGWLFRSREDHFDGCAQIGAVRFSYYGTVTGAARAVAAGEADASFGLTDVQLTTLESVPGVELIQAMLPGAECRSMAFNTRSLLLEDATMRQLLEYCADKQYFLSMSSGGAGMTGSSFASPGTDYFAEPSGIRGFDPEIARSRLMAMGYADWDDNGVLESPWDQSELSVTVYSSSQDIWASTAAAIVTADMEEIGIRVSWVKTESPVTDVCTAKSDWDICFIGWNGSMDAPMAASSFRNDIGGLTGWNDPTFDALLAQLRSATESPAIVNFAQQLQQRVYDECPAVVLAYSAEIQAVRSRDWTGYSDILEAAGGLFRNGSAAVYMQITPAE